MLVLPMKLKIKVQQMLVARNCWIPKDVDDVDLDISSFWLHEPEAWFQKMSGERSSLNSNNIIPMPPAIYS